MNREIAVLAGGCFWGMEDLFRKLPGVLDTEVGYCGGESKDATYVQVKTGTTGHAEALRIEFDPKILSFGELLKFFFKIHDPTSLNRQGNDIGSQYRSAIFCQSGNQMEVAQELLQKVESSGFWKKPLVTEITGEAFFISAEEYHQDYLKKNPGGYTCHYIRQTDF